jgi:predicted nucleotidyltransferase
VARGSAAVTRTVHRLHNRRVISDAGLSQLADRLCDIDGVVGVVLGGSRARGAAAPDSDVDLGVYYTAPLDVAAVRTLAAEISDSDAQVTAPGGWGPWVDGGGWLTVAGTAVDLIYRDLGRVRDACAEATAGRYAFHFQVGHPLGVPDIAYAGEIGVAHVLADPTGALHALHDSMVGMPQPLREALVRGLWEAEFLLGGARKGARRADATYVAGCLYRVVGVALHALHGYAGRWLINDKGAVASADALGLMPPGFGDRVHALLGRVGASTEELGGTLDAAAALVAEVRAVVAPEGLAGL